MQYSFGGKIKVVTDFLYNFLIISVETYFKGVL